MEQPKDLGAQAFWRADFANAALAVHNSASRDLRVRLSSAAELMRWGVMAVLALQALFVLAAWGVTGLEREMGDVSGLGVRVAFGALPQMGVLGASLIAMGLYLARAVDDVDAHRAQTQTLEFVGRNLMERMRYEEWRDHILSAAANDRAIFLARCTGIVREFCRNPGAGQDDYEAVRAALRADVAEPHPTLDIMNALDFTGHTQLKTLIAGKRREFRDYVASIKRRMSESFADLQADPIFGELAATDPVSNDKTTVNDARRRRFSRAMRHFAWLDQSRDQLETGMPAYQLEGMKAFMVHDNFLENLGGHFAKARRVFALTNGGFLALWGGINLAHIAAIAERVPAF